ncbi:MAG: hypothetical protein A2172_02180 [Candidatus Woykebacteria bacterium RBG_13_40_15]|uniref:Prepilin-type N-terminal cleavage/methylation domain-containing protein n=1 Tax=Candidatus Woykebacteria bacterium RBG_13_40_15 TaxID=1802593 RepID=A0A1G1W672_9BACT|nr:MAG: hypothetical protein A2172_02180 [Candidatus Woykebacteria bacterium RBG_13_40_15]
MGECLPISKNPQKGFTLIETLIATAVIAIAGAAILSTIVSILKVTLVSQDIVRAQNLANEKMEVLKNMPYDELSTQCGTVLPHGGLLDVAQVNSGGYSYLVLTYINFVDDPFDGNASGTIPGKPQDFYAFDYKKVTIEVRQPVSFTAGCSAITQVRGNSNAKVLTSISTNISANAAETSDDTGILFLQVIDSNGDPVPNANVTLTNVNLGPTWEIVTITDVNGDLQIPLLPEDTNNSYHLEVSLPEYSSDQTYPDNIPGYNPTNGDFNILAQQVADKTLKIDLLANLQITVVNESGAPVPDLEVAVAGSEEKAIYKDPDEINPYIPKYSDTFSSGSGGVISIADLEWDNYSFSVPDGYYIISTNPYQNVSVPAGSSTAATLKVTTDSSWPQISQVAPNSGLNNLVVSVEVLGANLPVGSILKLVKSGQSDIIATDVVSSDSDTKLSCNFDLTGVATGTWDLVVTKPDGKSTTQTAGFTITGP